MTTAPTDRDVLRTPEFVAGSSLVRPASATGNCHKNSGTVCAAPIAGRRLRPEATDENLCMTDDRTTCSRALRRAIVAAAARGRMPGSPADQAARGVVAR
ncbi:hypothetical protein [Nocardia sp. NPDC049149]|uniref:hypothetical protein n=1 Tax=Nocardia sp. NPDC049149 TaxID=3364315 RepID=UPI00371A580C